MIKEDILAKNFENVKKKVLVNKNKLNCIIVLSRVFVMLKGQGWFEETSGTLLTPSSPREATGNDPYGLHCRLATRLEFYNSAYCGLPFLKDVYVYSFEFYKCWKSSSSFLLTYGSPTWTTPAHHQWPRPKIYQLVLEDTNERDKDRTTLQHHFSPTLWWFSRS